jgi:hypothetical protein
MGQTSFTGPVRVGTALAVTASSFDGPLCVGSTLANSGKVLVTQSGLIAFGAAGADATLTFTLPAQSQIVDVIVDVLTAFNSGTSDNGLLGIAAAGVEYANTGIDLKTSAVRLRPTFTATQLAAMDDIGTNTSVVFTQDATGTNATAGSARVTLVYSPSADEG